MVWFPFLLLPVHGLWSLSGLPASASSLRSWSVTTEHNSLCFVPNEPRGFGHVCLYADMPGSPGGGFSLRMKSEGFQLAELKVEGT